MIYGKECNIVSEIRSILTTPILSQNTKVQVKNSKLPSAAEILSQADTGCSLNFGVFQLLVVYFLKSLDLLQIP